MCGGIVILRDFMIFSNIAGSLLNVRNSVLNLGISKSHFSSIPFAMWTSYCCIIRSPYTFQDHLDEHRLQSPPF